MADTSTPTPMGQMTQAPQASEMPGDAGNRERLRKIQEDRTLIHQQLKIIQQMKWTPTNKWGEAVHVALNGKNIEPADMMYKRFGAMNDLLQRDATLAEEERHLVTPNPITQQNVAEATDRGRRTSFVDSIDEQHKVLGLPPVPAEIRYQFIEKGISLNEAAAKGGAGDEIKGLIDAANLGEKVGSAGVPPLDLKGKTGLAASAGAKNAEKVREDKTKEDNATLPVLGLFKKPGELLSAMHTDFRDTLNTDGYYHMEKYEAPGAVPGMTETRERKAWSKEETKNARAAVAARWPGYEKYFPNYIEKGFTDIPPIDPNQGGLDVNKIRKELTKPTEKK